MAMIELSLFDAEVKHEKWNATLDDANITIRSDIKKFDDVAPFPVLHLLMVNEHDEMVIASQIRGYDDIDLLRRYCEMTLELFEKNRLG